MRGLQGARGGFGAVEVAGVALGLRQHERHPEIGRRDLQRGRQHVARFGRLAGVDERGPAPGRDFRVPRIQHLDLGPRVGRLLPPPLMLVELRQLHPAAEKLRLIVEQIGQRLDGRVGRARGFLRIGQQHRPFGILRLFEDDAAEERDGVGRTIGVEIEPREREIDGEIAGAVAARDLEGGHRPLRIGRDVVPRLPRLALFGERGEHRAEDPVGFLVLRIDLERVFGGQPALPTPCPAARRGRRARRAARRSWDRARSPCAAPRPPRRSCRRLRGSGRGGSSRRRPRRGGAAGAWARSERHSAKGSRVIIRAADYNSLSYGRGS